MCCPAGQPSVPRAEKRGEPPGPGLMLHLPLVVGAEPAGTGRASLPLTCPPFLPLCSSSLSLTPESWTGEREGGGAGRQRTLCAGRGRVEEAGLWACPTSSQSMSVRPHGGSRC